MQNLISSTAHLLIYVLQTLMLVTALLSWIPQMRNNRIYMVLSSLIEPIVLPFRKLLYQIPALREFPLDLSFLAAYLTLTLLESLF